MEELDARADTLRNEVARATQDGAALREDASAAASRASEARATLVEVEKEIARLASQVEMLGATKAALGSELSGLRHEVDALRRANSSSLASRGAGWKNGEGSGLVRGGTLLVEGGGGGGRYGGERGAPLPSVARATRRVKMRAGRGEEDDSDGGGGGGNGGLLFSKGTEVRAWKGSSRLRHRRGPEESDLDVGGGVVSGGRDGNLVEIVAEFQGRLRRQVQAALADGGVSSFHDGTEDPSAQRSSSLSRV